MRLSWRAINLLFLVCSAQQFTSDGHIAAFTPLLLHELGLSDDEVAVWTGLLFGIMMGVAFPLAPFWGVLAERYSRRLIIVRSYYIMTVALLILAWAPDVTAVIVSRVLMGLCFATIGVTMGMQALLTPPAQLGRAIATVQASHPIAASLGPPLGALAIPYIGLRGLFVVDAMLNLAAALALTLLLPEQAGGLKKGSVLRRTREVLGLAWSIKPIRWAYICGFLQRGASAVVDSYLPVRITQLAGDPALATTAIGWILGLYGLLTTVATWVAGRVVEKTEPALLYVRVMFVGTLVTIGLALAPWLWLLAVLAALRSIPVAFSNTVIFAFKARVLPPDLQTPIFSLAPMPRNIGGFLFPILAAAVAGFAPGAALAVGALGYGALSLASTRMQRAAREQERPWERGREREHE